MPDISIIVPTHNVGLWIGECIESILVETEAAIEVLVVDDGSTDDTVTIVEAIAKRDSRVTLVRALGSGGAQARDQGVELARGEFIAFADGDDIVPEGAYSAMLTAARNSGSDLVIGRFFKYFLGRTWHPTRRLPAFDEARTGVLLADHPSLIANRACWNRLFRRDWWIEESIRFPGVPRSNDIVPMTKALTRAKSIDVVPDIVYIYRDRPGSSSMTSRSSAAESLESYLSQEIECRSLVLAVGSDPLLEAYDELLIARDGWVHLRKYLLSKRWVDLDPDRLARIESLVRRIVELVREREIPDAPAIVRWAWALVAQGDWESAARIALALDAPPKTRAWPHPGAWLEQADRLAGTTLLPRRTLRAILAGHVLRPIATGGVPPSVELALALAGSADMLVDLFSGDDVRDLGGHEQQLLLMIRAGVVGVVPPATPELVLMSVSLDEGDVVFQVTVSDGPEQVSGLRFEWGSTSEHVPVTQDQDHRVWCRYPATEFGNAPVAVFAELDLPYGTVSERLRITAARVVNRPTGPLVVATAAGELRLLPTNSAEVDLGRDELARQFLSASVTTAVASGTELRLVLTPEGEATITAARLFREANGSILSRPFDCTADADGRVVASRRSSDLVNRRWVLLATFRTPFGDVEYPVKVSDDAVQPGAGGFSLRVMDSGGLYLVRDVAVPTSRPGAPGRAIRSVLGRSRRLARSIKRSLKKKD